jgi:hypothetical protein
LLVGAFGSALREILTFEGDLYWNSSMYGAAADESAETIAQVARFPSECPARGLTATSADAVGCPSDDASEIFAGRSSAVDCLTRLVVKHAGMTPAEALATRKVVDGQCLGFAGVKLMNRALELSKSGARLRQLYHNVNLNKVVLDRLPLVGFTGNIIAMSGNHCFEITYPMSGPPELRGSLLSAERLQRELSLYSNSDARIEEASVVVTRNGNGGQDSLIKHLIVSGSRRGNRSLGRNGGRSSSRKRKGNAVVDSGDRKAPRV